MFSFIAVAQTTYKDVWVDGYLRPDGQYVEGHYRRMPVNPGTPSPESAAPYGGIARDYSGYSVALAQSTPQIVYKDAKKAKRAKIISGSILGGILLAFGLLIGIDAANQ